MKIGMFRGVSTEIFLFLVGTSSTVASDGLFTGYHHWGQFPMEV